MATTLLVRNQIEITASAERVWEVLTDPHFIKQWDDIPESYSGGHLKLESVLDWEGYSRLTVTAFEKPTLLSLKMYLPKVNLEPTSYNVAYSYQLNGDSEKTTLLFVIGDFATLPNAQDYFDSTLEWVETARLKIKELAEN